jgi:hypothetical protein
MVARSKSGARIACSASTATTSLTPLDRQLRVNVDATLLGSSGPSLKSVFE